jgi:hypothetical protein
MVISCNVFSQNLFSQSESSLRRIELLVTKDILTTDVPPPDYYIGLSYDFSDSISILLDNVEIFHSKLDYKVVDSTLASYPYNRRLINLSGLAKNLKLAKGKNCQIKFWQNRGYVEFELLRPVHFYDLGVMKGRNRWTLTLLNVLPWP